MRQLREIDFLNDKHLIQMVEAFGSKAFLRKKGFLGQTVTWDFDGLGTLDSRSKYATFDSICLGEFFNWILPRGWIFVYHYCKRALWGNSVSSLDKFYSKDALIAFCKVLLLHHSLEEVLTYDHRHIRFLGKFYLQETG